ncbi:glycosyltransferase family 4 protein [Stratiformator vulcanicus]|uniref:Glycosyl transferases group 1 n=1 Tax=Stratiformator vulcanicus TaxID=2527980 RepID=A0A517R215_9PLAN|nr:glycosyltransferase family 4 protein [Stratiformator vulcanicus]QDT37894.1 hypothetical protein Pan189_22770 [Stratiformator vulcanicus]
MNLVIAHHHLNRGGVTRVIAGHLQSLAESDSAPQRVLIVYGGRHEGWPPEIEQRLKALKIERVVVPSLDYNDDPAVNAVPLAQAFESELTARGLEPGNTLLHVHNHSLGKNVAWPGALKHLSERDWPLLLQIHDFAEDFRPKNYGLLQQALGESMGPVNYLQGSKVHYAVLNRRDETALVDAGVNRQRLHFLPNPVPAPPALPNRAAARHKLMDRCGIDLDRRYLLYPVRGIRRKNLGEAVLLSLLMPGDPVVGITLVPLNPMEKPFHDAWRAFAERIDLPVRFGVGESDGLTFEENLAACDACLTTSVAEGFGMAFLEPWLLGKPLLGRNLPEITADFVDAGVNLDGLYSSLQIPLDWLDEKELAAEFRASAEELLKTYNRRPDQAADVAFDGKTTGGTIDFADLSERSQMSVIETVAQNPTAKSKLLALNSALSAESDAATVHSNADVVRHEFSTLACGKRLVSIYQKVIDDRGENRGEVDPRTLLDRFLDLERFRLIRGN